MNDFRRNYMTTRNERIGQMRDIKVVMKHTIKYPSTANLQAALKEAQAPLRQVVPDEDEESASDQRLLRMVPEDPQQGQEMLEMKVDLLAEELVMNLDSIENFLTRARWKLTNLTYQVQSSNVL